MFHETPHCLQRRVRSAPPSARADDGPPRPTNVSDHLVGVQRWRDLARRMPATTKNPNCIGRTCRRRWRSRTARGHEELRVLMVEPEGRQGLGVNHWVATDRG